MYHIVYMTTNLINQKFYIGVHSTWNLNDNYLGSGIHLKRAIKKHGKDNFKRDILYYCLSEDDTHNIESLIVDEYFINRTDTYNINCGGNGSWSHINLNRLSITKEANEKRSKTQTGSIRGPFKEDHLKKLSIYAKNRPQEHNNKISKSLSLLMTSGRSKIMNDKQKENKINLILVLSIVLLINKDKLNNYKDYLILIENKNQLIKEERRQLKSQKMSLFLKGKYAGQSNPCSCSNMSEEKRKEKGQKAALTRKRNNTFIATIFAIKLLI